MSPELLKQPTQIFTHKTLTIPARKTLHSFNAPRMKETHSGQFVFQNIERPQQKQPLKTKIHIALSVALELSKLQIAYITVEEPILCCLFYSMRITIGCLGSIFKLMNPILS